ncbi:MAG: Ppx/GppA phosphatase family protein [Thermodesulfovibrionales bacterium]|jgi:exopolyphosphatase/guanosine-5'-triphosphate,3'-diphosphate pyrophosphatase
MVSVAIDVGSNTLRMLIGSVRDDGITRIYADRSITRLAEGIGDTGNLREKNMEESVSVLKGFSRAISRFHPAQVRAVGTSALRNAQNRETFLRMAYRESGIEIEVISGMREAALTAHGVMAGFRAAPGSSLIIDIGGGSTEWIIQEKSSPDPALCGTVPLGVVNLSERFIKTDPPSRKDITALMDEVSSSLISGRWGMPRPAHLSSLIGTGGTVTTLACLDLKLRAYEHQMVHMHQIPLSRICRLKDMLLSLPLSKRKQIAGLEAGRADLIIPGILLTMRLMEILGFDEILVSDYGLLEGLIKEMDHEKSF